MYDCNDYRQSYYYCDLFLRCVIAELFLDGQRLFDLSQLLDYCSKTYQPDVVLKKIPDKHIRVSYEREREREERERGEREREGEGKRERERKREREMTMHG